LQHVGPSIKVANSGPSTFDSFHDALSSRTKDSAWKYCRDYGSPVPEAPQTFLHESKWTAANAAKLSRKFNVAINMILTLGKRETTCTVSFNFPSPFFCGTFDATWNDRSRWTELDVKLDRAGLGVKFKLHTAFQFSSTKIVISKYSRLCSSHLE